MQLNNSHKTYFICATQTSNLGDLVINKMLIDELCKYGCVYLDASNLPLDFKRPLLENQNIIDTADLGVTVKSPSFNGIFKFLKLIKTEHISFLTRSPGPLEEPSFKVRLGFSIINLAARLFGVKVVYFGNCCSEALANSSKIKTTYMNSVYVRSFESEKYAKQYFNCKVGFIPDMAFLLNGGERAVTKKPIVAVDFRSVSDNPEELMSDIKNNVKEFLDNGYSVELFYQVKGDKPYVEKIYQEIKQDGVSIHDGLIWYDEMDYFADKSFVYSNRLHSLLIGAMYGAIPVARITNDPRLLKIEHVFKSSLPDEFCAFLKIETSLDVKTIVENQKFLLSLLNNSIKKNGDIARGLIANVLSSY